jgi:aliphatic nitrilase
VSELLQPIRVAAVQAAPVWLDRDRTVEKSCDLIAEAGRHGADVVGFPENFIPGHPVWFYYHAATSRASQEFSVRLFNNAVEIPSPVTDRLCRAAARANVNVVMGLTERREGSTGTLFNSQVFISREGRIVSRHRKLVPTVGERLVHAPGDAGTQSPATFDIGRVSGLICGENSNPLAIADLGSYYPYVHVASWPNHFIPAWCGMQETSLLASRNAAYINKCYALSACGTNSEQMIGELPVTDEDREFLLDPAKSGGTAIVDPYGTVVAGPLKGDEEGILYLDTDPDMVIRGRFVHDFAGHYNRPDIFQLRVKTESDVLVSRQAATSSAYPQEKRWQDAPAQAAGEPTVTGGAHEPTERLNGESSGGRAAAP